MTVLISAITGQVASQVAARLGEHPVRALARDRSRAETVLAGLGDSRPVELVVGALDDEALLARALADVEVAFLSVGTDPRQVELERGFIDAARHAGLPHLVKLSTIDVGSDSPNPVGRWHTEIEHHLAASGVPNTILRPAYFTTNLLRTAAPSVARAGRWSGTSPSGRIAMIGPADVAAAAAAVILDPGLRGHTYELTGPHAITLPQVAEILSDLLGQDIAYVPTTPEVMRRAMAERGVPDYYAEVALGIDRSVEAGLHQRVTPDFERLVGRPAAGAQEVLAGHVSAFSSEPGS